jgi:hypothetical protein
LRDAEHAAKRRHEAWLGLSIVKQIVDRLGSQTDLLTRPGAERSSTSSCRLGVFDAAKRLDPIIGPIPLHR